MRSVRIGSVKIGRRAVACALALASVALAPAFASRAPLAPPAALGAPATSTQPGAPRVSTGGVSGVKGTSAVLEGSVDPRNLATTYYFQYGPTATYGSQTATASLAAGDTAVKVKQAVGGFLTGYHYRLVATNAEGTKDGRDRTFKPKVKNVKSEFVLPETYKAVPYGTAFSLSGALTGTGNGGRAIVLQATPYPYRAPFADISAPIATTATGRFTFRVDRLSINTKFRVATVGPPILYSPIVPEQVAALVTLHARSSRTGLARLYGTVTPAAVGARVFFQLEEPAGSERIAKSENPAKLEQPTKLEKPGKGKSETAEERAEERAEAPRFATKFSTVVKRGTKAVSRFSAVVSVRDAGRYRAFVAIPTGPVASGHSTSVQLHAAPKKKQKKSKHGKKKT
jgi:hypothetical protein